MLVDIECSNDFDENQSRTILVALRYLALVLVYTVARCSHTCLLRFLSRSLSFFQKGCFGVFYSLFFFVKFRPTF